MRKLILFALCGVVQAQVSHQSLSKRASSTFQQNSSYSSNEVAMYNGTLYLSLIDNNGSVPGTDATWYALGGATNINSNTGSSTPASFGSLTGQPTDNTNLANILNGKAASSSAITINGVNCALNGSCTLPASGSGSGSGSGNGSLQSNITSSATTTAAGNEGQVLNNLDSFFYGGGRNYGPVFSGGWSTTQTLFHNEVFQRRGIHHATGYNNYDAAAGDAMALGYGYFDFQGGGGMAASDEGKGLFTYQYIDQRGYMGTIQSGGGLGVIQPTLSQQTDSAYLTTDEAPLLDITKGQYSGNLNGYISSPVTGLPTLNVTGVTLPTSTWGAITDTVSETGHTADVQSAAETHSVQIGSGTFSGGKTCAGADGSSNAQCYAVIAGPEFAEQVPITQVGAVSNGTQNVTFTHHYPHSANARIFQGGVSGMWLSSDEVLAITNTAPAYQGEVGYRRTAFHVYGSTTGKDLIVARDRFSNAITAIYLNDGVSGISSTGGFHLYPGAEIVANTAIGHAPLLEPNPWNWANGDSVENPHPDSNIINGEQSIAHLTSPLTCAVVESCQWRNITYDGVGITNAFHPMVLKNLNPADMYGQAGSTYAAPLGGPDAISIEGPHDGLITANNILQNGFAIRISAEDDGADFGPFDILRLFTQTSSNNPIPDSAHLTYTPATSTLSWDGQLVFPNTQNIILNRFSNIGFAYNSGGPQYIALSNNPNGGYGTGDTWASLDGAHNGDHKGNMQMNNLRLYGQAAGTSGTRFVCMDSNNNIVTQTSACSGN